MKHIATTEDTADMVPLAMYALASVSPESPVVES